MRLSNGTNVVGLGETHAHAYRRDYRFDGTSRGIIFCHGAAGDEKLFAAAFDNPNAVLARDALRHCVRVDDSGGNRYTLLGTLQASGYPLPLLEEVFRQNRCSFGNPNSTAHMDEAYAFLTGPARAKAGRVAVIGVSMGFLVACNWARRNPFKVAGIIGIVPACDLAWFRGTDARHAVDDDAVPGSMGLGRTSVRLKVALPDDVLMNVNTQPPWDLVVTSKNARDQELDRKVVQSASRNQERTETTITVTAPFASAVDTASDKRFHLRPRRSDRNDGSGTVRDYGLLHNLINNVYPSWSGDAQFNSSVYPERSPVAYAPFDDCFALEARLFVNAGDDSAPANRAYDLAQRWNESPRPGNCLAVQTGDHTKGHDDWTVPGQLLLEALASLSW
jgi:pimeloyl-ACP methyl ester carboxylesterase